jgi:uncharacterized protein YkwD
VPNTTRGRLRAAVIAVIALLVPAVAPSHASAGTSRHESRILNEINAVRAQHGLAGVGHRGMLAGAASRHSSRLKRRGQLQHSSTKALARRAGARVGEVIAWSSNRRASARSIVRNWMNSPPHRAVLLDGSFRRVGVGASRGRRGLFVTADFASR